MRARTGVTNPIRFTAFLALSLVGVAPIVALFYSLYVHLPRYLSILWRGLLGASFAIAGVGLIAAWLCFLFLNVLMLNTS